MESTFSHIFDNGTLSIVGQELKEIPSELGFQYGYKTSTLTLSENLLTTVNNLEKFSKLTSLILDNNYLSHTQNFPSLPSLQTLWVNNNKIESLDLFLNEIEAKFPNLAYLSMLKNPCCPNYFVGKDTISYRRYRFYVVSRLPSLRFLDSAPISEEEKREGRRLASMVARPKPEEYKKKAKEAAVEEDRALPVEDNLGNHKASFGVSRYIYYGRQSEGNRFIVDEAL
eukprot:TRINITY_DN2372_c0_g1_i1.p1 TRINITY_DN2372_c0_g1~~TRINITY_DN2372_c0_g1_i1.p1  ORF type:complete len:227 (+),score=43.07 TRINITY_DN2372_c0_g1_i1:97-777(+)